MWKEENSLNIYNVKWKERRKKLKYFLHHINKNVWKEKIVIEEYTNIPQSLFAGLVQVWSGRNEIVL